MTLSALSKVGAGQPIPIDFFPKALADRRQSFNTGYATSLNMKSSKLSANNPYRKYPILPHDLASDIQQFAESHFAKQYFSTHRTGIFFRRTVPVEQMMTWQKVCVSTFRALPFEMLSAQL